MADDIEREGEALEDLTVAVAEHHLLAVPEGVVVILAVMDRGIEWLALIVNRVAPEHLPVEVERVTEPVISLIDSVVVGGVLALGAHNGAWQDLLVPSRVDRTLLPARDRQRPPKLCSARLGR